MSVQCSPHVNQLVSQRLFARRVQTTKCFKATRDVSLVAFLASVGNITSLESSQNIDELRWATVNQAVIEHSLVTAFRALTELHFDPVLIKGWSVSRFYPQTHLRTSTDIDIAVAPDIFDSALSYFVSSSLSKLNIDLHRGLRDRDTLDWADLLARTYTVDLNGVQIRVLSEEDNLRVTAAHWLIDGGVYKERLWDIYYLVQNRKKDFDWSRSLEAAGPIRKSWVIAAIAAARDYLSLDVSDLPDEIRQFELPTWFKRSIVREWTRGPYLRIPLWMCIRKPRTFIEQIRRRFPPNSIAATTDTEGVIDASSRIGFQVRSMIKKVRPFLSGMIRIRRETVK